VGESKDYHIVITREGESVVKPRWCGDRIPVFKDSLDLSVYLFRRKTLYCAFTDYRKAFDSVYSILLWQKLLRTSIDGNKLIAIQNMYKLSMSVSLVKSELFTILVHKCKQMGL
jgi:hypothetical protein